MPWVRVSPSSPQVSDGRGHGGLLGAGAVAAGRRGYRCSRVLMRVSWLVGLAFRGSTWWVSIASSRAA